jgi:hypothetical protein
MSDLVAVHVFNYFCLSSFYSLFSKNVIKTEF